MTDISKAEPNSKAVARPDSDDYRDVFLSETPMIDLRAPCEFNKGLIPDCNNGETF